jgi:2-polyprenyl-6-methoxyphenol hydroxylase-like FAD-dependent oxidoreductase
MTTSFARHSLERRESSLSGRSDGAVETLEARLWDVVVVGAGPAGALAAYATARRGLAVLLVDKASFPRSKVCGCCLNGRALATLSSVGLGGLVQRLGAVPLRQLHLAARGCRARVALPQGAALSRSTFDAALVEAAVAAGAMFKPKTQAALGEIRANVRHVRLRREGREAELRTRLVLAAGGLATRLLAGEDFTVPAETGSRLGAGVIVERAPAFYTPGTIFMAYGQGGYVGSVRLEDGRLDMAAALDPAEVKSKGGLGEAAAAIMLEAGFPAVPELPRAPWRGTPQLTRRASRLAGPRVFVLGDAAGYIEPFTGEGIAWALAAAAAVAPLAERAVHGWQAGLGDEWTQLYQRTIVPRQRTCRAVARLLRAPRLARLLITVLACVPWLASPLVRRINASVTARE